MIICVVFSQNVVTGARLRVVYRVCLCERQNSRYELIPVYI